MLSNTVIEDVIHTALSTGGDFAEIYVEDNCNTDIYMLGGKLETGVSGTDFGIGIRVFNGVNSAYAYTNHTEKDELIRLAAMAAASMHQKKGNIALNLLQKKIASPHTAIVSPSTVNMSEKIGMLKMAHHAAKSYDGCISQTQIRYLDQEQNILVANSDGLLANDKRVRTRTYITALAESNGQIQSGFAGPGALMGFEFYNRINIEDHAREAARKAKTMLYANYCPTGKMPVIVDNGFGGLLFHEACGHSLEASSVAKGLSVFSNKVGQKIASDILSLVDDGTIVNAWGSMAIDDEGNQTKKNILIENGILKGYLIDKLGGRRMGMSATGSSRRQSYRFAPTSRMTNTYIANGKSTKEEIIANTEYGLFAKSIGAGSVNPATGDFNFSVVEGYMIKNGRINIPVKSATLIGNGEEILNKVDMIGNNLELGQGYCMAESGTIFVSMGQPTIRIQSITVGGRSGDN